MLFKVRFGAGRVCCGEGQRHASTLPFNYTFVPIEEWLPLEGWGGSVLQGTFGDIWKHFGCYSLGDGTTGVLWVEARDVAKLPIMHRSASHNTELSCPKESVPS